MQKYIAMFFVTCVLCVTYWTTKAASADPPAYPKTKINPKDSAEMVLIPAGEFLMGTSENQLAAVLKAYPTMKREWFLDELPQRKVELDAYYIYITEVTVAQYRKFCTATKHAMPKEPPWKWQDNQPIVNVSWNDAKAYADWAGASLPTEAQWEKAARGTDGRVFPWGDKWDAARCANKSNSYDEYGNYIGPKSVASFKAGASPYGIEDMAGNTCEWCADWYGKDYYKIAPLKNPTGPKTGEKRILRGGSWNNNGPVDYRGACRDSNRPDGGGADAGFRCVVLIPAPQAQ
ncbi:MAG: Serine/threonine-protein kinase pkn1 [bacterium ADurb.Bin429]|nr:MAG: Serine/threonine-protein kinase pkn1 [bacterium ADurb.Bin429]